MFRYLVALFTMLTVMVSNAYAIPAFARQMGVSCTACHASNGYPVLTRFGRDFKASGYTMIGSEDAVTDASSDTKLSLPSALNMSIIAEPSMTKASGSNGTGTHTNVDTSAVGIFMGGRIGEHMGSFVEFGYDAGDGSWGLGNLVLPITYKIDDYTYGFVLFNTDGHGSTASFELLHTTHGAIRHIGARDDVPAQGVGVYVYNENFYANYTAYVHSQKAGSQMKAGNSVRAVFTPQIGAWDLAFGGQYMFGNINDLNGANESIPNTSLSTDAYLIDFQAMGNVGNLPLVFDASYGVALNDTTGLGSAWAGITPNNRTSIVLDASLGIIPGEWILLANYAHDNDGTATAGLDATNNAETAGIRYFFMKNVFLESTITFNSSNQAADKEWGLAANIAF